MGQSLLFSQRRKSSIIKPCLDAVKHLHRTCQKKNRYSHGCRLCTQETRTNSVRIWWINLLQINKSTGPFQGQLYGLLKYILSVSNQSDVGLNIQVINW